MNARAAKLLTEVLELPTEEREAFTAQLLASIDGPPDARTDAEWKAELARRLDEARRPDWVGHEWSEVRRMIEQDLRAMRK